MQRKSKILLWSLVSTGVIAASVIGVVVGVNIKNNQLYKDIQNEMVNIFTKGIGPIYRETFHTRKVADYITKFVSNLGITVQEDNDYPAPAKKTEHTSGNLIYDIPASSGCDNWIGVTLQAHMDMVCNYDKEQEPGGHDWSNGVDIVQEGNILHSRDYKTNIGADDGVGLSMILALTKYHNKFTHGPIRVLITADEEDGDSGASVVTSTKLKYERIINIDGSCPGQITKSCAGTYNLAFNVPLAWSDVNSTFQQFQIHLSGLKGVHSGCLTKDSTPTTKIPFDLLKKLAAIANVELLELNVQSPNNYLPNSFDLSFATDKTDAITWINNEILEIKEKYPLETGISATVSELTGAEKKSKSLSTTNTTALINLFATDRNPISDKIPLGVINWLDESQTTPETSSNIAPVLISNNADMQFQTLTRSCHEAKQEEIANSIKQAIINVYPAATVNASVSPPWELKQTTPELVNLLMEGFKKNGVSTSLHDSHGWLECAYFAKASENSQIASIGAKVSNEHDVTESTDISSYPSVIKTLFYLLQNIK